MPTRAQLKRQADEAAAAAVPEGAPAAAAAPDPVPEPKPKGKKGKKGAVEAAAERAEAAPPPPPPAAAAASPPPAAPSPPEPSPAVEGEDGAPARPPPIRTPSAAASAAAAPAGLSASGSDGSEFASPFVASHPPPASQSNPMSQESLPPYTTPPATPLVAEEGGDELSYMEYVVTSALVPSGAWRMLNEVFRDCGEKDIPFEAITAMGDRGGFIRMFTVATLPPGFYQGRSHNLLEGHDPAKVACIGVYVVYQDGQGVLHAKIPAMGTRLTLLPSGGGFQPNAYLSFAVRNLAQSVRTQLRGPPSASAAAAAAAAPRTILLRYPRKQKTDDPEYLGTLGTLSMLGFSLSQYAGARPPVTLASPRPQPPRVMFKRLDAETPVEVSEVRFAPTGGVDAVMYKYRLPGTFETGTFTFSELESVVTADPGRYTPVPVIELLAHVDVVADGVDKETDITIPDFQQRDPDPAEEKNIRRGGRRITYRKKARKGKTAKRRH